MASIRPIACQRPRRCRRTGEEDLSQLGLHYVFEIECPLAVRILKTAQPIHLDSFLIEIVRIVARPDPLSDVALNAGDEPGDHIPWYWLLHFQLGNNKQKFIVALVKFHPPAL